MTDDQRFDLDEIRALIALATASEIAELEVETPHLKVKIKTSGARAAETHVPGAAGTPERDHRSDGRPAPEGRYAPIVAPVSRCQSPISTHRANAVSVATPRRHPRRPTTSLQRGSVAIRAISPSSASRRIPAPSTAP